MKLHFRHLTNNYFFFGVIFLLVGILTGINNFYFYSHVERSGYRNASQLESILKDEIVFCRKNRISGKRYRENIEKIVKNFSKKAYYNDTMILLHETKGLLWNKKIEEGWDKTVTSHIYILIPKLKSQNNLSYYINIDSDYWLYGISVIRSMTGSIFDKGAKLFTTSNITTNELELYKKMKIKKDDYSEQLENLNKDYKDINITSDILLEYGAKKRRILSDMYYDINNTEFSRLKKEVSKSEISSYDIYIALLRSRPAIGFAIFTIVLIWLFRKRELEIAKTEQELEQEKRNKEILETTFGVKEQNEDIELYEAIMSKDITKLKKIKSINPTMNILKFNALIEHTEQEKLERLKILIEKGIDLKFKDEEGMTALMYYALGNKGNDEDSKIIELLIQKGLDIDAQNDSGMTALMLCAVKNRPASVQILVDNGADININQDLTAKELAATPTIRDIIGKVENHYPKKLVSLLSNFGVDPKPMKDSVHEWDFNFYERYGTFKNFLAKLELQWNEVEKDIYELSPNLHSKIQNFLFEDKNKIKNWYSQDGDELAIGWSSLSGLKDGKDLNEWCDEGNDPFKYELSQSYETNGKDIKLFGKIVKLFKQEIQVRREGNILHTYFINKERELDQEYEFEIETFNLEAKQFYTDKEKFIRVMDVIFDQFKDNKDFKNIVAEIIEDQNGQYYDLRITQYDSFSGKSATQLLKKVSAGSFASIKVNLKNLCDWSVESHHSDVSYRVNFLKSSNKADIENLEQKAPGFTHVMRFYL